MHIAFITYQLSSAEYDLKHKGVCDGLCANAESLHTRNLGICGCWCAVVGCLRTNLPWILRNEHTKVQFEKLGSLDLPLTNLAHFLNASTALLQSWDINVLNGIV